MTKNIDIGDTVIVTKISHPYYTQVRKILRTLHNNKNGRLLRCRVKFIDHKEWMTPTFLDLVSFKFYLRRKILTYYE